MLGLLGLCLSGWVDVDDVDVDVAILGGRCGF